MIIDRAWQYRNQDAYVAFSFVEANGNRGQDRTPANCRFGRALLASAIFHPCPPDDAVHEGCSRQGTVAP